jgi:hypothetical protein
MGYNTYVDILFINGGVIMKDLKHEGKETKSEFKVGGQDNRGNMPKQPGAYNPQQKQPLDNTQKPLPGKTGQDIGGGQGRGGVGGDINNKGKGFGAGKVDLNKKKDAWK